MWMVRPTKEGTRDQGPYGGPKGVRGREGDDIVITKLKWGTHGSVRSVDLDLGLVGGPRVYWL